MKTKKSEIFTGLHFFHLLLGVLLLSLLFWSCSFSISFLLGISFYLLRNSALERPHGKSSISITIIFYFLWVNPSMPWRISLLTKGSFPIIPDNNGFDDRSKEKKENADNHPRRIVAEKRLTFPFPFVHHQPHDWKVDQKLMERRTQYKMGSLSNIILVCFLVFHFLSLQEFIRL